MRRPSYRHVLEAVAFLRDAYGCGLAKFATEDEGLVHDAVRRRFAAFSALVEVELKIGGAGARGDLELCRELGIELVIVPMVETSYALSDFLAGVDEIFGKSPQRKIRLGMNFETETAIANLAGILRAGADKLTQATVGRGDLSKSLGARVDDDNVLKLTARVVREARKRGLRTSVGGGIEPGRVGPMAARCRPDYFNTRNFAFKVEKLMNQGELEVAARDALLAEVLLSRCGDMPGAVDRRKALLGRLSARAGFPVRPALARILQRAGERVPC